MIAIEDWLTTPPSLISMAYENMTTAKCCIDFYIYCINKQQDIEMPIVRTISDIYNSLFGGIAIIEFDTAQSSTNNIFPNNWYIFLYTIKTTNNGSDQVIIYENDVARSLLKILLPHYNIQDCVQYKLHSNLRQFIINYIPINALPNASLPNSIEQNIDSLTLSRQLMYTTLKTLSAIHTTTDEFYEKNLRTICRLLYLSINTEIIIKTSAMSHNVLCPFLSMYLHSKFLMIRDNNARKK